MQFEWLLKFVLLVQLLGVQAGVYPFKTTDDVTATTIDDDAVNLHGNTTDVRSNDETHTHVGNEDETEDDLSFDLTIEEVCVKYSYPLENCTCVGNPELKDICDFIAKRDTARKYKVVYDPPHNIIYDQIHGSLVIIASFFGIIGNSLVIVVTIANRKEYNYCHKLIGGLAVSDNFFALLQLVEGIPKLWTHKWLYGLAMCKTIISIYNLSSWMSMSLILLIAIERYHGVVHHFSDNITAKINLILFVLIITGIAIISPMTVHLRIGGSGYCTEEWNDLSESLVYSWILMFISFIIPLVVISILYGKIVHVVWKSASSGALNDQQQVRRMKSNKRTMIKLVTVFVAFAVLVFPIRIIWLLADYQVLSKLNRDSSNALIVFGLVPYSFHVAINPIIYSVVDHKFRASVKHLLNVTRSSRGKSTIVTQLKKY